jgi:hypothetical protein
MACRELTKLQTSLSPAQDRIDQYGATVTPRTEKRVLDSLIGLRNPQHRQQPEDPEVFRLTDVAGNVVQILLA